MSQRVLGVGESLSGRIKEISETFPWCCYYAATGALSPLRPSLLLSGSWTHLFTQPNLSSYYRYDVHFDHQEDGVEHKAGENLVAYHDCAFEWSVLRELQESVLALSSPCVGLWKARVRPRSSLFVPSASSPFHSA